MDSLPLMYDHIKSLGMYIIKTTQSLVVVSLTYLLMQKEVQIITMYVQLELPVKGSVMNGLSALLGFLVP